MAKKIEGRIRRELAKERVHIGQIVREMIIGAGRGPCASAVTSKIESDHAYTQRRERPGERKKAISLIEKAMGGDQCALGFPRLCTEFNDEMPDAIRLDAAFDDLHEPLHQRLWTRGQGFCDFHARA